MMGFEIREAKVKLMTRNLSALAVLCGVALCGSAIAQEKQQKTTTTTTVETAEKPDTAKAPTSAPADSVTTGSVTVGGKTIEYQALAGTLTVGANDSQDAMLGLDGKWMTDTGMELPAKVEEQPATARMFYTAFFAKGADEGKRPVVFFYNGGPGSATMYLRMASMGPARVVLQDVGHPFGGPYQIVPNQYSLLDVADIVFIDAPGTGYSRRDG